MRFNALRFSVRIVVCALSASVQTALFAAPSTYDDMAALRPSGGVNDFWDTTAHAAVAIDIADSNPIGLDSRVPQPAAADEALSYFDSRWLTSEESNGDNLNTFAPGTIILFR